MKRKLCLLTVMLLLGIYAAFYLSFALLVWLGIFLLLFGFAKCFVSGWVSNWIYALAAGMFFLGSTLLLIRGDVTQKKLYSFLDEYVDVTAVVTSRPEEAEGKISFQAKITELSFLKEHIFPNETVFLKDYDTSHKLFYGDVFTARLRFNLPSTASNEGSFDYALYLKTKNIFFSGYVDAGSLSVLGRKQPNLYERIRKLGFRCADLIDRTLTPETACMLKGILLGDKSGMSDELRTAFSRSGLSHIVAVSGTHVSALLVLFFGLFRLFGLNRRRTGLFAIAFLWFFVCMIGMPASAVRAGIMASLAILAEFVYRKADTLVSISAAAMLLLWIQPFAAFDPSFLLSFGAVLGIVLFQSKMERALFDCLKHLVEKKQRNKTKFGFGGRVCEKILRLFITAVSAQILIVPIVLFLFQEFSFWGLLTNLLVLPLLSFVLGSGALLCIFGLIWEPLAFFAGGLSYLSLLVVRQVVLCFGTLPFGYITFGAVTVFFVFFYFLFVTAFYLLLCKRKKLFAMIPMASGLVVICLIALHGVFEPPIAYVRFVNIGQGDCSCISLPNGKNILIDAGGTPSYREYYDVGKEVVRPYLLKHGIHEISWMIASHGHDDHIGGLISIMRDMPVRVLLVPRGFGETEGSKQLLELAAQKEVPVRELSAGEEIALSELASFAVLMPTEEWADNLSAERENERSLILRFDFGETSVLYTGDMELEGEEKLVEEVGEKLKAEVLKVAHHGSKNASSQRFLNEVLPEYAVIPVGKNNFDHPHDTVLSRLQNQFVQVFRTDENRDIVFTLNPKRIVDVSYTE